MADNVDHRRDLRLQDRQWRRGRADVLAECPDGADVQDFLHTQGWETFLTVGSTDDEVYLWSWQRGRDNEPDEYLLQVASGTSDDRLPGYLLFATLPELLDAFSRWAPLAQAAAVVGAMKQLRTGLQDDGLVETIAARVAYGLEYTSPALQRAKRDAIR